MGAASAPPDEFDWIQLTSGEWLKGEIKSLYDRKLEFDSVKLDLQEFDWKDVKQVRGPRIFSVRLAGPVTVYGILQITENKVIVTNGDDQQVFNRDRLFAIVPKAEKRIKCWSGKISFGFNFSCRKYGSGAIQCKGQILNAVLQIRGSL